MQHPSDELGKATNPLMDRYSDDAHAYDSPRGANNGAGEFGSPESDYEYFEAADLMPAGYARVDAPVSLPGTQHAIMESSLQRPPSAGGETQAESPEARPGLVAAPPGRSDQVEAAVSSAFDARHDDTVKLIEQDLAHAATALSRRIRNRGWSTSSSANEHSGHDPFVHVFCLC